MTFRIVFLFLITFTSIFSIYSRAPAISGTTVDFLGQATLPAGFLFKGTELGGLSGITYDSNQEVYYVIADDRSKKAPARFYTLKINLTQGSLKNSGVIPIGVTTLLNETNQPFAADSLDPEGIALTNKETVFISSEGDAERLVEPFIKEFSLSSGQQLKSLAVPSKFLPTASRNRGIRNNLAFESLTITPDQKHLFTATENALIQDSPKGTKSSPLRILQYNLLTNQLEQEFLYMIQPVEAPLKLFGNLSSGLVDLLALDNQGHFLSLERSFNGLGYTIQVFEVYVEGADDIRDIDSLSTVNLSTIKPVRKQLLMDFQTLSKVTLDNIEGLTFGPQLPDGRQSLIVVSDNNFQSAQHTQILALGIKLTSVENSASIVNGGNKGL